MAVLVVVVTSSPFAASRVSIPLEPRWGLVGVPCRVAARPPSAARVKACSSTASLVAPFAASIRRRADTHNISLIVLSLVLSLTVLCAVL